MADESRRRQEGRFRDTVYINILGRIGRGKMGRKTQRLNKGKQRHKKGKGNWYSRRNQWIDSKMPNRSVGTNQR